MFGGQQLANNTAWLKATLDFATDGFVGAQKIKQYPKPIRPVVARFIPELRRIPKHYDVVRSAVKDILRTRGYIPGKSKEGKADTPSDFLQWMIDDAKGEERDWDFLADILLKISFAALHTSAATPMQMVYDLCEHPEYITPLRKEIREVSTAYPTLDKRALGRMRKLDSFMKESLRFNPLLLSK
jgi:cytochrome P450